MQALLPSCIHSYDASPVLSIFGYSFTLTIPWVILSYDRKSVTQHLRMLFVETLQKSFKKGLHWRPKTAQD